MITPNHNQRIFNYLLLSAFLLINNALSAPCPPEDRYNNCKICDNLKNCTFCNNGYFLNSSTIESTPNQLVPICLRCPTGCLECSPDECTSCKSGYFIHRKTDNNSRSCGECSEYCKECKNTANQCT